MIKYMKIFITVATTLTTGILIYACGPLPVRTPQTYTSNEIPGAFGYRFGDSLDKSMIIYRFESENPLKFDEQFVKPIIKNKEFDFFSITTCRKSNKICSIRGFKIFDRRDRAINYLENIRPIIEKKYGLTSKTKNITNNVSARYEESVRNQYTIISLIVMSHKSDWCFIIKYSNEYQKNQCSYF